MTRQELVELLDDLADTPAGIGRVISTMTIQDLTRKPSANQFSVLESVCHLRDIEREGYAVRIEKLLNETKPLLPDLDGARLAAERDYNSQDFRAAFDEFASARESNVHKLREATLEQLESRGMFEGVGEVTLERLLELMREHDAGHLQELRTLCASV